MILSSEMHRPSSAKLWQIPQPPTVLPSVPGELRRTGAGYIVFGGFCQYLEFGKDVFVHIFDRDIFAKNTDSV